MAFLSRTRKIDLLSLIDELGLEATADAKVADLIKIITGSKGYDENFCKNRVEIITEERQERIKKEEEEADREFELKKLELESKGKEHTPVLKKQNLLDLMTCYDMSGDISVYLKLFERQINRVEIPKENWVTYLLRLLPLEIVNIIGREKEELTNDYDYVKRLLLRRFKLTPEQFRQKFFTHRKEVSASWRDFAFELNNFLEEWLVGLNVLTYDDLKELFVIDQIRKKLPFEMREHFVDLMPKFTKVVDLIETLDDYEAARTNVKKIYETKNPNNDVKRRFTQNMENKSNRYNSVPQNSKYEKSNVDMTRNNSNPFKIKCFHCNEYASHKASQCPRKKEGLICFRCKQIGHRSDQCTFNSVKEINISSNSSCTPGKIVKTIEIKGKKVNSLVDSGSDVTMICSSLYKDLGSPNLKENDVKLTGISGKELTPIGFFNTDISIDAVSVSCDVYVLNILQHDMILGNNLLNKINFEVSDSGMKVTGKRNNYEKSYDVNFVTVVPSNRKLKNFYSHVNIPMTYPNLRISSFIIPSTENSVSFSDNLKIARLDHPVNNSDLSNSGENEMSSNSNTSENKSVYLAEKVELYSDLQYKDSNNVNIETAEEFKEFTELRGALEADRDRAITQHKELQEGYEKIMKELHETKRSLDFEKEQKTDLSDKMQRENSSLASQLEDAKLLIEDLEKSKQLRMEDISSLNVKVGELQEKLKEIKCDKLVLKTHLNEALQGQETLRKKNEALESEVATLKLHTVEIRGSQSNRRSSMFSQESKKESEASPTRNNRKANKCSKFQEESNQVNQIDEEMQNLKIPCDELNTELDEKDDTISKLKEELIKASGVIEYLTKEKDAVRWNEALKKQALDEYILCLNEVSELYKKQLRKIEKIDEFSEFKNKLVHVERELESQKQQTMNLSKMISKIEEKFDDMRIKKEQNILKIQEENRKSFNRKRKKAKCYQLGDLVAIQKTQFGVGTKLRPKFLGPYKVTKIKSNDRYDVEKVGFGEGPVMTSSAADHMKPWTSIV